MPATSTALAPAVEAPRAGCQKVRMVVHQQQKLRQTCACPAAQALGQKPRLAHFSKVELQQELNATYGSLESATARARLRLSQPIR